MQICKDMFYIFCQHCVKDIHLLYTELPNLNSTWRQFGVKFNSSNFFYMTSKIVNIVDYSVDNNLIISSDWLPNWFTRRSSRTRLRTPAPVSAPHNSSQGFKAFSLQSPLISTSRIPFVIFRSFVFVCHAFCVPRASTAIQFFHQWARFSGSHHPVSCTALDSLP